MATDKLQDQSSGAWPGAPGSAQTFATSPPFTDDGRRGGYDLWVRIARWALPVIAGMIAVLIVAWPSIRARELSFVLSVNSVEISPSRLAMHAPVYRGLDAEGRPFTVTADAVTQRGDKNAPVSLQGLSARLGPAGSPQAVARSPGGIYDIVDEELELAAPAQIRDDGGTRLLAGDVTVDLRTRILESREPVTATSRFGQFAAQGFSAVLENHVFRFTGGVIAKLDPLGQRPVDLAPPTSAVSETPDTPSTDNQSKEQP
ncbi:MAG: LPS export ABC transporter periplasmic protein LptC [Pseudomonadota bacterium]